MRKVIIAGLVLVVLVAAIAWVAWYSPWLAVSNVEVTVSDAPEVAGPLTVDEVTAAAGIPPGTPMLRVDPAAIEARIAALPLVRSVHVDRAWPTTLRIDVRRRVPVAVTSSGAGYELVDRDGVVLRTVDGPVDGIPSVAAVGEGLPAAIEVAHDLPGWLAPKVEVIKASTRNDVTLTLRNGATVLWGSAEEGKLKGEVLRSLLRTDASRYDVSAPGVPTTSDDSGAGTAGPGGTGRSPTAGASPGPPSPSPVSPGPPSPSPVSPSPVSPSAGE